MRVVVESYRGGASVTPDDDTVIAPTRALFVGGTGNVKVDMADGTTVTFSSIPVGIIHELSVTKIYETDTTATDIVALY